MALAKKPLTAIRTVVSSVSPKTDLVDTATLDRGRVYSYAGIWFEKGVPEIITDPVLLEELEEMMHDVKTADNEIIERNVFIVERQVPRPQKGLDPNARPARDRFITRPRPKPALGHH